MGSSTNLSNISISKKNKFENPFVTIDTFPSAGYSDLNETWLVHDDGM